MFMTTGKSSSKILTLEEPMEPTFWKVLISIVWFFTLEFPSWVLSSIRHCSSFTSLIFSATTQTLETFSQLLPSVSRVFCTSVLWVLPSCLFSVQLLSVTTWRTCMLKLIKVKCVKPCSNVWCNYSYLVLSVRPWALLKWWDSLMTWYTLHSLACCSVTSCQVLCLMHLEVSELRMNNFKPIRKTSVTSVTFQEKSCKSKAFHLSIILWSVTIFGTTSSTFIPWKRRALTTTLVLSIIFPQDTTVQTKK